VASKSDEQNNNSDTQKQIESIKSDIQRLKQQHIDLGKIALLEQQNNSLTRTVSLLSLSIGVLVVLLAMSLIAK